jgi:hypothetical protein
VSDTRGTPGNPAPPDRPQTAHEAGPPGSHAVLGSRPLPDNHPLPGNHPPPGSQVALGRPAGAGRPGRPGAVGTQHRPGSPGGVRRLAAAQIARTATPRGGRRIGGPRPAWTPPPGWTSPARTSPDAAPSQAGERFPAAETPPTPPVAATLAAQVADRPSLREWLPPLQVRMLTGWRAR